MQRSRQLKYGKRKHEAEASKPPMISMDVAGFRQTAAH